MTVIAERKGRIARRREIIALPRAALVMILATQPLLFRGSTQNAEPMLSCVQS
jgi:hypothetical protein